MYISFTGTVLSGSPITCGYIEDSLPFVAYKSQKDTINTDAETPLKIWTEKGCYCYEPSDKQPKLTFEHYPLSNNYLDRYCYSIKTNTGILRETFLKKPLNQYDPGILTQECALYYNPYDNLCSFSQASIEYSILSDFFAKPIQHNNICNSFLLPIILKEAPDFNNSVKRIIDLFHEDQFQSRPFLVSKATTNISRSAERISHLYESFDSYQSEEMPLIIYSRRSPMRGSRQTNYDYLYVLCRDKYVLIPTDVYGYTHIRTLECDKIHPIVLSKEAKQLLYSQFPKEFDKINDIATNRLKQFTHDNNLSAVEPRS